MRTVALRHLRLRPFVVSLVATAALLLAPSAASAAWTVSPTPNVAGASWTNLRAVDCSSANSCMAVGCAVVYSGWSSSPARVCDGGRALGRHELADHADPGPGQSDLRGLAERRLVPAAEHLLRCRQHAVRAGPRRPWSSSGTGRAGRSSRARPFRAALSVPSPARAPGLHRGRSTTAPAARSRSAGTAPAGTSSPSRTPRVRSQWPARRLVSVEAHLHRRRSVEWLRR